MRDDFVCIPRNCSLGSTEVKIFDGPSFETSFKLCGVIFLLAVLAILPTQDTKIPPRLLKTKLGGVFITERFIIMKS